MSVNLWRTKPEKYVWCSPGIQGADEDDDLGGICRGAQIYQLDGGHTVQSWAQTLEPERPELASYLHSSCDWQQVILTHLNLFSYL